MKNKPAPLPTGTALSMLAQLAQREVVSKSDLQRLQTLAKNLSPQTHKLGVVAALPLLFGEDTVQMNAETSLRKLLMRLGEQQTEAISEGRMFSGEVLSLQVERKNTSQSHQLWFSGQASAGAQARTHDLEGVGLLLENPALAPELLGNAAKGCEPILLLTVNDHETAAVRQVFSTQRTPMAFLREDYPYQLLGYLEQRPIITYRCQMGSVRNGAALVRTLTAIHHHRPSAVIAVGIAFGKQQKQKLGDVLISEQVQTYESERLNKDDSHNWRAERIPASSRWLERCTQIQQPHFQAHKGLLLCGEKLLDNLAFRALLTEQFPTAIGGDMESAGLVAACHENKVDWVVVKGVSDWGDGSKAGGTEEEKDELQIRAAMNAAKVVYSALFLKAAEQVICNPPKPTGHKPLANSTVCQSLMTEARTPDFVRLPKVLDLHGQHHAMARAQHAANANQAQDSAHQILLQWLENQQAPPVFALLGEYGMGKTVSCQRLYRELRALRQQGNAPAWAHEPLYFDLRQLSIFKNLERQRIVALPSNEALINDLITHGWVTTPGQALPRFADVQALLAQGGLMIIDGLDECLVHLVDAQHPQFVATFLNILADASATHATRHRKNVPDDNATSIDTSVLHGPRLLLSCRTNFFKSLSDQRNLFTGQHRGKVDQAWYQALVLLPLTQEQIDNYLTAVLPGLELARMQDLISHTHNLGELAQRPMTLKLLAEHIPDLEAMRQRGELVNGAALYGIVTKEWLERDFGKHHLEPEHKMRLMPALAAHLWNSGVRSMPYGELHAWFHLWRAGQADLAERYAPAAYNQNKLEEDLRTATFVVRDDGDEKNIEGFRFAHSSLVEFFLARYLADAVLHDRFADWSMSIPSAETMHFLAEILQNEQTHLQRKYSHTVDAGQRISATLNRWRTHYHEHASELLLAYAMAPYKLSGKRAPDAPRPVLAGFDLHGAQLRGWVFGAADEDVFAREHGGVLLFADMRTATLAGPARQLLGMQGCDFSGADLCDASFNNARLDDAKFSTAKLDRVSFQHCSLQYAHLPQTGLVGTMFRHCALGGSVWQPWGLVYRTQVVECSGLDGLGSELNQVGKPWVLPEPRSVLVSHSRAGLGTWAGREPFAYTGVLQVPAAHLALLDGHCDWINCVAFAPDGVLMASASYDHTVRVWDTSSGECLLVLAGHDGRVKSVAFAPEGARIASTSDDGSVKLWDAASGAPLATLNGDGWGGNCVAFAPDGTRLACGYDDNNIRLWDAASGVHLASFTGHSGRVLCIAFAPNGTYIASGSSDNTVKLWDAASATCLSTFKGHCKAVTGVAFASDGARLASTSHDKSVMLWDITSARCLTALIGHSDNVTSVAFSADNMRIVSSGWDHTVKIWDSTNGVNLSTLSGHNDTVTSVAFSRCGTYFASSSWDKTIKFWDTASGTCRSTIGGGTAAVLGVAFSSDGTRIVCASSDQAFRLWDAASSACLAVSTGHGGAVCCVAFSPSGERIVSGAMDKLVKQWDATSGDGLSTLKGHLDNVADVTFAPDGTCIASASNDGTVRLWDTASGACLHTLKGHKSAIYSLAFAPDGAHIASASADNSVKLWDVASHVCMQTMLGHGTTVWSVAFSPDGRRIVSGSNDGSLKLWDVASGATLATLTGHGAAVSCVAFSPDGTLIASSSLDQTLMLWDASSGAHLTTFTGHNAGVNSLAFAPNGTHIATASNDGTMRLWDVGSATCLRIHWANNDPAHGARGHAAWRPAGTNGSQDPGELLDASGDAWRVLGWRVYDHPCAPGTWTRLPLHA